MAHLLLHCIVLRGGERGGKALWVSIFVLLAVSEGRRKGGGFVLTFSPHDVCGGLSFVAPPFSFSYVMERGGGERREESRLAAILKLMPMRGEEREKNTAKFTWDMKRVAENYRTWPGTQEERGGGGGMTRLLYLLSVKMKFTASFLCLLVRYGGKRKKKRGGPTTTNGLPLKIPSRPMALKTRKEGGEHT